MGTGGFYFHSTGKGQKKSKTGNFPGRHHGFKRHRAAARRQKKRDGGADGAEPAEQVTGAQLRGWERHALQCLFSVTDSGRHMQLELGSLGRENWQIISKDISCEERIY